MGNKHVDGVITDYFHALLDEGESDQKKVPPNTEPTPTNTTNELPVERKVEPPPVKKKKCEPPPDTVLPRTEEPSAIDEVISGTTVEMSSSSKGRVSPEKPASPETANNVLENKSNNTDDLNRDTYSSKAKTDTHSVDNSSTAAYEQHKQRLEKMLQQVSVLETQTEVKTAPVDTPSVSEQPSELAVEETLTEPAYQALPVLSSEWLENGRPNWAQDRFDILLIEVNGLQLAVPLVALGQIQVLDEHLTPLFGQSDWFMGLQQSPIGSIKTVNTAKFVMPERYQNEHDYKYVVSINGLNWGLAVDCIHQPISIDPDAIRWRPTRSNRPWMAGMVKDHMCVLLDIPSMGELLQKQDKNHQESTGG